MRFYAKISSCVLVGIYAFIPFCLLYSNLLGFDLSLSDYTLFSIIFVFLSVLMLVAVFVKTELFIGKVFSCLFGGAVPLGFVVWLFYLSKSNLSCETVCVLLAVFCIIAIIIRIAKGRKAKIITSISCVVSFLVVTFFMIFFLFMGSIGASTVLDTIQSPDGVYYADVIDVDQGAFGGNTVVEVSKKRKSDILIFCFEEKGKQIYIGEWNEYDDMEIYWKDDSCLVINSKEYIMQ